MEFTWKMLPQMWSYMGGMYLREKCLSFECQISSTRILRLWWRFLFCCLWNHLHFWHNLGQSHYSRNSLVRKCNTHYLFLRFSRSEIKLIGFVNKSISLQSVSQEVFHGTLSLRDDKCVGRSSVVHVNRGNVELSKIRYFSLTENLWGFTMLIRID